MPKATRRRTIDAPPAEVWRLVSDPHSLPRWWPRVMRVENVDRVKGNRRSQWTKVLRTGEGRGVRADYRCISSAEGERYAWEQQLADTPFEKHLRESEVEVALAPADGGTEVTLTSRQTLRGLSRLGSPLMSRGQGEILEEALDGMDRAIGGGER